MGRVRALDNAAHCVLGRPCLGPTRILRPACTRPPVAGAQREEEFVDHLKSVPINYQAKMAFARRRVSEPAPMNRANAGRQPSRRNAPRVKGKCDLMMITCMTWSSR